MDFVEGILRVSDLFGGLSDDEIKKLLPLCREGVYQAGEVIFSEGDPCHTIYIVASGKVALEMKLRVGLTEETITVDTITRGGCLCCSGLIDPYILTATGRTIEKTEVIALDPAKLLDLFEENCEAGYKTMKNLAKVVSSRLQSARETVGHVLSLIFHDFKAPLAAVEAVNRLILRGYVGELNEEQRNMLRSSSKRISTLLNLVTNIIDVTRAGAKDLAMSVISLEEVIIDSVEMMQPLAQEKGLRMKTELNHSLPPVYGDGNRLRQVLINLLSNAIKFAPSGGMVTVKAREGIDDVQVEVLDNGRGIPAEELPKIFDDFYRGLGVDETGAGLGLSIAKRIIEAHGGKIWAVSPCPGSDRGSQFVFTLPKPKR